MYDMCIHIYICIHIVCIYIYIYIYIMLAPIAVHEPHAALHEGLVPWRKTKVVLVKVVSRIIDYFHVRIYMCVIQLISPP